MDEGTTAVPVERIGIKPLARIGLVGAAAAAIVAVAILAAGARAAPSGTLAAAVGTIGSGIVNTAQAGTGVPGGPDGPGGFMGGHGRGMGGFRAITIDSISGSSISLKTADGWTRTITVDSGTTYSKDGLASTLAALAAGDEIRFTETKATNGNFTINSIAVIPPHAGGTVTAVSDSTITVTEPDGTSATITVISSTTYQVNGAAGTLAGIKAGMMVQASGTRDAAGALTATQVQAGTPGQMAPGHNAGLGGPGDGDNDGPNGGAAPNATTAPTGGANG